MTNDQCPMPNPNAQFVRKNMSLRRAFDHWELAIGHWPLALCIYVVGPAFFTEAGTSFSNAVKFSTNIAASLRACSSYLPASGHGVRASSTLSGPPGQVLGISMLKIECLRYCTLSNCPVSAAVIIARVYAIFMREPTP